MSLKRIFSWLYAKTLDRAMTERRARDNRAMNPALYRPVCLSYVSRTMLISLFLLLLGGWNSQAWAQNRNYTVTVGVGVGKGTVYAELWKAPIGGDSKVSSTEYVSQGGGTKSKTDGIYWLTDAFGKFYAIPASGYSFESWHDNDPTCSNSAAGTTSPWSTSKKNQSGGWSFVYYAKFTPISYEVTLASNGGVIKRLMRPLIAECLLL